MNNTVKEMMHGTVLVEFFATWCPHCQHMIPVVDQVEKLLEGKVRIVRIDIDKYPQEAKETDATTVPTFILYHDGNEVWRHTGEITREELLLKIQQQLPL